MIYCDFHEMMLSHHLCWNI